MYGFHTDRAFAFQVMRCQHSAGLCLLLLVQLAGGTAFPLKDAAGQKSLGLADPSSSQRHVAVAETKTPEPLPEFDPDNPLAIGIILAFHRWPDEDEQRIILEKTREAGLTKTEEIPRFKIWLFEWDEWRKAAAAEEGLSQPAGSFLLWTTVSRILYSAPPPAPSSPVFRFPKPPLGSMVASFQTIQNTLSGGEFMAIHE